MHIEKFTSRHGMRLVLGAWALAACAGLAMAEPKDGEKGPAEKGQDQTDVLGGPKVRDDSKPGETGRFAPREGRRDEVPHTMVVRFLKKMASEETAEDVRLNAEQVTKIESIEKEHQDALKAYRQTHREEVMKLREILPPQERRRIDAMMGVPGGGRGEGRGPEGRGPEGRGERPGRGGPDGASGGDEMMPAGDESMDPMNAPSREELEKARGRLKEIADGAPKTGPVTEKMYAVLTEPQREYAKKEIAKQREEQRKRAEERAKERGERGGERGGERMPAAAREALQKLSPEEREAFEKMSPEEKRAFVRKLMDEAK